MSSQGCIRPLGMSIPRLCFSSSVHGGAACSENLGIKRWYHQAKPMKRCSSLRFVGIGYTRIASTLSASVLMHSLGITCPRNDRDLWRSRLFFILLRVSPAFWRLAGDAVAVCCGVYDNIVNVNKAYLFYVLCQSCVH